MNHKQLTDLLQFNVTLHQLVSDTLSDTFDSHEVVVSRFTNQLVKSLLGVISADAIAFLSFDKGILIPKASHGLLPESMGRRFAIDAHPRFSAITQSKTPVIFDLCCEMPDPYDGLLIASDHTLPVHACMGIALSVGGENLGVVTFDSLEPRDFESCSMAMLSLLQQSLNHAIFTVFQALKMRLTLQQQGAVVHELSRPMNTLIGEHPCFQALKQEIELVANSDLNVLIQGETGTGKELVARYVHQYSNRHDKPYVQINCAALAEGLAESEFFGHRKGAFTGANSHRDGKFLLADTGTLFLDEVGELSLPLQSKLLRVLQSGEIQPVGSDETKTVNVRIIAATNRDLQKEVNEGRFRADLFHRLSVYPIQVPTLKQRLSDVVLLSGFFIEQLRKKLHVEQFVLTKPALNSLKSYDWPGNVRELEHILSRAALKAKHQAWPQKIISIEQEHLALNTTITATPIAQLNQIGSLKQATEAYQALMIRKTLEQANYNWSYAARGLGMDRANLVRLAKRLGITLTKQIN
ncbi:anaerobic nitric oxide reductase transcription regulator [Pseudoalteromonas luteoviolacea B = ATCC 29581]|nr:anaerobic nitric oxide reductase transcription regulator [Pseudoalteromonas luteoviolacea B = ATCC 29581]